MATSDRVLWREAALVLAAAVVQIGVPVFASRHDAAAVPPAGVALLALGVAAIPLRLRTPTGALALAFVTTLTFVVWDPAPGPVFAGLVVTFVHAVLTGHRRAALTALVAGYVLFSWLPPVLGRGDPPGLVASLALAAWLLVLYTGSELVRSQRARAREAEQARVDALRRQVANERLAIARELHDAVAHNLALIHLQAGVALHVHDDVAAPVHDSLTTIKTASKEALVELRSILGVLRHVDDGDAAPRAPAPGLARVHELAARAEAAGVDVTLCIDVDPTTIPRAVDVAAYRIVQESLTNVARHADPPVATVAAHVVDGTLVLAVADAGTGRRRAEALPSGGNGLPGMRERAASVGGSLVAGPRLDSGFLVEARLPLERP